MAKKKPTTRGDDAPVITTHKALAEAVGVERSTITKRLKRDDCPVPPAGPWDHDDVAALVDAIHTLDSTEGSDDLKRAQALKARVLAAKYLQQMSTDLGRLGNAEAELAMRAMSPTTTLHWQQCRQSLGDLLVEVGGLPPAEADHRAEQFARGFYDEWTKIFRRMIEHHAAGSDDLAPIVRRIRKLAAELEIMPDVDPQLVAEIVEPLDELASKREALS